MVSTMTAIAASDSILPPAVKPQRKFLGSGTPRGYGLRPRLTPDAAAAFATFVDAARTRAGLEGRTLVYTVRWG
jgi:hypothetical protein